MTGILDKRIYQGARYGKEKREKERQQQVEDRRAKSSIRPEKNHRRTERTR